MLNVIPTYKEIKERDPEAVYNSLRGKNTYLLESAEGGEKVARFSFVGFNPVAKLTIKNGSVKFEVFDSELKGLELKGNDPLEIMRNIIFQFKLKEKPLSRFFGGFVGYFSYDLVRYFYNLRGNVREDLKEPDCEFILAKNNIIFDHKEKKTHLIHHQFTMPGQKINDSTSLTIKKELEKIENGIYSARTKSPVKKQTNKPNNFISNISKIKFKENVRKAKKYILDGDIFQVVLSQRLEINFDGDEFMVYSNLKRINPSSYMYYLDFGERKIVGSSPEMLVRVENRKVETYPIAGTRPRGKTPEEDKKLEKEMLGDEKEKAEHIMLVDLGRNDLGRVAKFGSVKVKKMMAVEKYSHVQHLVSEISGVLKEDEDEFSAFKSIFPAGTVSGAPKVRAMEIINELEPGRRGIYSGAVGYFSFTRNLDSAITIRTLIFEKDRVYIQAGAGIVADSKPEREYQETMNKAKAMLKALEV
jgi:anthranilate synthase component 1